MKGTWKVGSFTGDPERYVNVWKWESASTEPAFGTGGTLFS